jgi:tungstate transport system permease protein
MFYEVFQIIFLSLLVSLFATFLSLVSGIPLGTLIALKNFPGKKFIIVIFHTLMGSPPVVVGLFLTILFWRNGPLGILHLLYTPFAIVIAQAILSFPIIVGFTISSIQSLDPMMLFQLRTLGFSPLKRVFLIWKEAKIPLFSAIMAGFGSAISEVGASLMVGGNISGRTRIMTTAIVLESSRGDFEKAVFLAIVLFLIAFTVNLFLTILQQRR